MSPPRDDATRRLHAQQATLFGLLKSGVPTAGKEAAWKALTEAAAKTLGVQRASIWMVGADREELHLEDLYELRSARHSKGAALDAKSYPAYFQALRWNRAIVAPDAAEDERTREFAAGYLGPLDIVSMLDAGIWRGGEAKGVVCLESVGERRTWTADEQQFAGSIADLAASVLDNEELRGARARLEESEELFSRAVGSSPDWITVVRTRDGTILHVNDAFARESGYSAAEVIGRSTIDLGFWVSIDQRTAWIERVRTEKLVHDFEAEFRTRAGVLRTFQLSGHRVEIHGEECVVSNARDVTERRRQERLVQEIARGVGGATGQPYFRSLVDQLVQVLGADMAFVAEIRHDDPGFLSTIAVNAAGKPSPDFEYALAGTPCETIIGHGVCAYPDRAWELFPRDQALARMGIEAYVGAPLNDSSGRPLGLFAVLFRRPLVESKLAENLLTIFAARASAELERGRQLKSLEHQAHHDPLTGLPNRELLRKRLEAGMGPDAKGAGALLLIDLDRFKEINDTLGHHVGDVMLIRLSRRLELEMKASCGGTVARLGGDEFAVWIEGIDEVGAARAIAARALAAITAPLEIEGYRLEVGGSIGIALAPLHADSPSGLLRCADVAMYGAKRRSSGHEVYDVAQDPYSSERLALLSDLGAAISRGEMEVHYQPRLELAGGTLSGFEALVRWRHPRLGLLPPARFVPLAELSDVIRPLTLWVLGTALEQRIRWGAGGRIAVNLSPRHIVDDNCPEQIARILEKHGADPSILELEITESALIADPERAHATLERIRALGVRIAIDDFGTGYSSLSHLKRLPLQALKIDVSFVRQMMTSPPDRVIVDSTIALAHKLGLTVTAEGVEDESTLSALHAYGCDEGQGFLIGRPMPAPEATRWMQSGQRRAH